MRKALLIGALFSTATLTFATSGDNMIGVTPASRGMGGLGVGMPVGPVDSIFRNPAWMGVMENKFTVQFGGILFMPKVKARNKGYVDSNPGNNASDPMPYDTGYVKSRADTFVVPEIGIVHKISDRLVFGLGAFGVSGMGVDYRDKDGALAQMHTTFQFMRIIPAIAFKVNEMITVSGALHGAWGSLDMGAVMCGDPTDDSTCWNASGGQSQALGIGFQVGASLNFGDFLYAGITYQSPVSMTYKNVFDADNQMVDPNNIYEDLKLQQPQEVALGIGAAPLNGLKVGLDVRWINWKDADGYGDFKWDDQWVYALGAEYRPISNLALRIGYNYGKSPIDGGSKNLTRPSSPNIPNLNAPFSEYDIAWFNLIGFPAITEQHLTLGVGYEFSKTFGIDVSYVRAFEKKVEAKATMMSPDDLTVGAKNAQDSISVGLNWKF
ncbi:long-chain fatty acid transport protein [Hydrogenivirga caldilitoris]|uniref:Long-chain fatty acid transport protein n=1 Tax=Hydrogenivirga caldilitoris TaxID=246264 RepID=A0A497XN53_9AQUI|nr:outer membrane protein transport protein [Hydrogenivirga caldilitoris]RLJ70377.1 long-chain fatty acid transport protein [Hydrogenivirga caldilitoris]